MNNPLGSAYLADRLKPLDEPRSAAKKNTTFVLECNLQKNIQSILEHLEEGPHKTSSKQHDSIHIINEPSDPNDMTFKARKKLTDLDISGSFTPGYKKPSDSKNHKSAFAGPFMIDSSAKRRGALAFHRQFTHLHKDAESSADIRRQTLVLDVDSLQKNTSPTPKIGLSRYRTIGANGETEKFIIKPTKRVQEKHTFRKELEKLHDDNDMKHLKTEAQSQLVKNFIATNSKNLREKIKMIDQIIDFKNKKEGEYARLAKHEKRDRFVRLFISKLKNAVVSARLTKKIANTTTIGDLDAAGRSKESNRGSSAEAVVKKTPKALESPVGALR